MPCRLEQRQAPCIKVARQSTTSKKLRKLQREMEQHVEDEDEDTDEDEYEDSVISYCAMNKGSKQNHSSKDIRKPEGF
jgi:hypothetical protein